MSRSLVVGIVVTLLLISGLAAIFYYNYIREKEKPLSDAIPADAALIIETRGLSQTWKTIKQSACWKGIAGNEQIQKLTAQLDGLDSIWNQNAFVQELLSQRKVALSVHTSAPDAILLVSQATLDKETLAGLTETLRGMQLSLTKRTYEGVDIWETMKAGNPHPTCAFAVCEGLITCSTHPELVESAIIKLKYKLVNPVKGLEEVSILARNGTDFNLLINYPWLSEYISRFMRPEYEGLFSYLKRFANWSMLDVRLDEQHVSFSGATVTDDSIYQYLDLFSSQTPVNSTLDALLPANTAYALQLGFSDYGKFKTELVEYLQQTGKFDAYNNYRDSLEKLYDINLSADFENMIGEEVALGQVEHSGADPARNMFLIMKPAQLSYASGLLDGYQKKCALKAENDTLVKPGKYPRLPLGSFLKTYFGSSFDCFESPCFAIVEGLVVFANDDQILTHVVADISTGNTLGAKEHFKTFKQLSGGSYNFSMLVSTSRALHLPADYTREQFYSQLNRYAADYRKFEFMRVQFATSSEKSFYTQVDIHFNSAFQEESRLVWETQLDTTVAIPPAVVYNPAINQQCILVQDVKNNLYFVTRDGNILWKTPLNGRIISDIKQVDWGKNGSTEYLFNTASQAYIIDHTGGNVMGYPVYFPGKAIAGLYLTDLFGDSSFTWYVPLNNNRLMGYSLEGRPVAGFNPKNLPATPVSAVRELRLGAEPRLYLSGKNGELMIFGYKGEVIKHALPACRKGDQYFFKSIDTSAALLYFVDTSASLVSWTVKSDWSAVPLPLHQSWSRLPATGYWYAPGQQWYFIETDSLHFSLKDENLKELATRPFADSIPHQVYGLVTEDGKLMFADTEPRTQQLYLYGADGSPVKGFPLEGNSVFSISNLYLDGVRYQLGGHGRNYLRAFRLK